MTNLDCTVVNCAYNNDKCCSRNDISVKGDDAVVPSETNCGSFLLRTSDGAVNVSHCCTAKATDVSCEACGCRYNDSNKCTAKHIGIAGGHADEAGETECSSPER